MIVLAQLAQVHLLKVKAQEALFFNKPGFNECQQLFIRGLAVKCLVKLPIECADLAEVCFYFQRFDIALGLFEIFVAQQRY